MASPGAGSWRLDEHEAVPSTQDICRARAEAGEPEGLAVRADRQLSGRGTHGRSWQSPAGNLSLSVLLRPTEDARRLGEWSLLAGVAAAEMAQKFLPPGAALSCKWPNDVLLDDGKLAGLLVEASCTATGGVDWLVIGFGVNLAAAPPVPDRRTACIADHALPPAPQAAAKMLLERLDHWQQVRRTQGFAPVRSRWLAFAPQPGSAMAVRRGAATTDGTFAGLADDGSLLLKTGGGVLAFVAGET